MKALDNPPRENSPGKVIDDGMQIGTATVEQADQRGVDMPDLVGS